MITPELINYLKKQITKKIPKNVFVSKLKSVGWKESDIEEGLSEAIRADQEGIKSENLNSSISDSDKNFVNNLTENSTSQARPFFSKPITKVNSSFLYAPTIPSINTQVNSTESDNQELIPSLIPKDSFYRPKSNASQKEKTSGIFEKAENPDGFFTEEISTQKIKEEAMLASFPRDFLRKNTSTNIKKSNTRKFFNIIFSKQIILILIIICLGIGVYLAQKNNYINLPKLSSLNLKTLESLMMNNQKDLLANSPSLLSSLLSYKTETKIVITAPAKINSSGISNNNLSDDKNTTSIQIKSETDQKGLSTQSANGLFTIQSNSFMGNFVTNLKSNGSILFIPLSDLNQFVTEKKPGEGFVAIKENEYIKVKEIITSEFQESAKSINIHKLLTESLSANLNRTIVGSYEEYISSLLAEGEKAERILGIDTYKYNIVNDQKSTEKFFSELASLFAINSQAEIRMKETAMLITVDSFEVWLDQKNRNLFKFRIVFNIPMTELDKEGDIYPQGSFAEFDWQTTYYDFGVLNQVKMPDKIINFSELIREPNINPSPSVTEEGQNTLD
jgi:hypothetical protein